MFKALVDKRICPVSEIDQNTSFSTRRWGCNGYRRKNGYDWTSSNPKTTIFALHKVLIIFTNLSTQEGCDTRSIFKRSLTCLNSEFSFSKTSCLRKKSALLFTEGRIIGFIPSLRVLVLCEMQLVSVRIWTRVAVSISYDGNHYTTGTSPQSTNTLRNICSLNK